MVRRTRRVLRKKGGAVPCVKKSIRLGARSGLTADIKQECLMKAEKIHYGQELGCGEFGCAYAVMERGDQVVKITTFNDVITEDKWYQEACLGSHLGSLNIGPTVHNFFVCNGTGFILMARITDAKKIYVNKKGKPTLVTIREIQTLENSNGNPYRDATDHITRMPTSLQLGFATKLYEMIEAGFIHMDNHIENIGFSGKEPILFDFGFTQEREWEDTYDKEQALAFSIFQIIEHCPLDEVENTALFKIATSIINGTYTWGDNFEDVKGMTLADLQESYPHTSKVSQFKKKVEKFGSNKDLYWGNMCYATVITMEKTDRYSSPLMTSIYNIRTNK